MSSTPSPPYSSISRLYADAVQCVFAFLSVSDFVAAAQSHQQWLAFALSMPSRRLGLKRTTIAPAALAGWSGASSSAADFRRLPSPSASFSLKHHLRSLDCTAAVSDWAVFLVFLQTFPQLQRVQFVVSLTVMKAPGLQIMEVGQGPLRLPSTLLELRIINEIPVWVPAHGRFLRFIVALAATAPLLHTFSVRRVNPSVHPSLDIDLGPLLTLPHLTELVLQMDPSKAQMTLLATLPALRRLLFPTASFPNGSYMSALNSLGRAPNQFPHCEWIQMNACCTADQIDGLGKIATLTRLPSPHFVSAAVTRLHTLPQRLRRFDFVTDLSINPEELAASPLVPQLLQCDFLSSLQHLFLVRVQFADMEEVDHLFSRMPQLRVLRLTAVPLSSLSFLRHLTALEQCSFRSCLLQCRPDALSHVLALPRLHRFHCAQGPSDLDVAALQAQIENPNSVYARFDCFRWLLKRAGLRWVTLTTPRSHCPRRAEFSLTPDQAECRCELGSN